MLEDDGPSRLRDTGLRLGTAAPNTSAYKKRLLDQGAILETGRGRVTFAGAAIRYRAIEQRDLEIMIRTGETRERAEALAVTGDNPSVATPLSQQAATPACCEWMPRAKAQCLLKAGHRGSPRRHTASPGHGRTTEPADSPKVHRSSRLAGGWLRLAVVGRVPAGVVSSPVNVGPRRSRYAPC